MRANLSALIVATLLVLGAAGATVQAQSAASPQPDRTVGAAEVFYVKDKNKARAQTILYPLGDPNETGGKRETLRMDVIFEAEGLKVTRPQYFFIAFSSYSPTGPKYQKERDLTILTRDLKGYTNTTVHTRLLSSSRTPAGGAVEVLVSAPIPYRRFLEILEALDITVALGETKFDLKKDEAKALKDLNQTIEK